MKSNTQADCGCGRNAANETKGSQLGLDELMIVNPSSDGVEGMFLGDDGTLYRVQGLNEEDGLQEQGHLFLGDDGTLYRAENTGPASVESTETPAKGMGTPNAPGLGGYLLGADGTLYEVTE